MPGLFDQLARLDALTDRKKRVAVVVTNLRLDAFPQRVPHSVTATIRVSYPSNQAADRADQQMREVLKSKRAGWRLDVIADRPPMPERPANVNLAQTVAQLAGHWDIPLLTETSVSPSAAGLVPDDVPVLCGLGPVADEINTPSERVSRISLVQRTLLLSQLLVSGETWKSS
jgi:D-alanine-D-alanine ligase